MKHRAAVLWFSALSASVSWSAAPVSFAQDSAMKPIKLIVSLSPGTALDRVARLIADRLEKETGVPTVVENRPGASGLIATEAVARAAPDGSVLLFGGSTMSLAASVNNARAPHPAYALQPVARLTTQPIVLVVNTKHPISSVRELIEYAKRANKPMSYATGGIGSPGHFSAVMFARAAGIELIHVPYANGAALNRDVISGQVDLSFNVLPSVDPYLKNGQLRALAVTGTKRASTWLDVPTFAELKLGEDYPVSWYGVFAPIGTPAVALQKLGAALRATVERPEQRATFAAIGMFSEVRDGEQFRADLIKEVAAATEVAKREQIGVE